MRLCIARPSLTIVFLLALLSIANGQDSAETPSFSETPDATTAATVYTYQALNVPGAASTNVYAINNTGRIVGYIAGGTCATSSDQTSCGFEDVKGTFTTVACELDHATDFFDISNSNQVIGAVSVVGGTAGIIWEGNESCFDFSPPSGTMSEAWGVSGSNIVGYYTNASGNFEGYRYTSTTQKFANITCVGWTNTRAYGNYGGMIVGDVANSPSGPFQAMLYSGGKCTTFHYPGAVWTSAKGINKSGQISGWYTDKAGKFHGFLKTGTTFRSLNFPKAAQTQAYHLNDSGQVAGTYTDTAGINHGFIASPKAAATLQNSEPDVIDNQ